MSEPTQRPSYRPREIARRYRVGVTKVHHWINTKQLRAIDVSTNGGGSKPIWMILAEDLKAFEARRSALPQQNTQDTPRPRAKKKANKDGMIKFF